MTSKPLRRIFYDTEFLDDGKTIDLISLGAIDETGREFYAINHDAHLIERAANHPWLRENVIPSLPVNLVAPPGYTEMITPPSWRFAWDATHDDYSRVMSRHQLGGDLYGWLEPWKYEIELWAYYSAYDHVAFTQLWGPMSDLPRDLPTRTRDLVDEWEYCGRPELLRQQDGKHNAIYDARWNRYLWQVCQRSKKK